MTSNYQRGHIHSERPGLKPAGRVIDFRKVKKQKESAQAPQETVRITCGLCRFQFDRITKPNHLVLVCPSCGVRFEHCLPDPPTQPELPKSRSETLFEIPPKRLETTLHQPLIQNLQQGIQVEPSVEDALATDSPLSAEPFDREMETETYQSDTPISLVFSHPSAEEMDFDKEVQQDWLPDSQESSQETQWIANLITIAQLVLIAAALIGLMNGLGSYFHEDQKSTVKAPRGGVKNSSGKPEVENGQAWHSPENPECVAMGDFVPETNSVGSVVTEANTENENLLLDIPLIGGTNDAILPFTQGTKETVSIELEKPQSSIVSEQSIFDLPLFDIGELPSLSDQFMPAIGESLKDSITAENETASRLPATVEVAKPKLEEGDAEQQIQLQAKLDETEKKVQELLLEQEQIQTQSKKWVSETLLRESAILLEKNPTRSLFLSLKSIQILQELGLQVADWGKAILAQAYAALSSGEGLFERVPNIVASSVSSNGRWLLTSHVDRSLWLCDISRVEKNFPIDVSPALLVDILLTPDEEWFVGARADGQVAMWDMTVDPPTMIVLREQIPGLNRVQISPDGRWLVAHGNHSANGPANGQWEQSVHPGDWNGVWMWDMNTFKQGNMPRAVVLRGHDGPIRCLAISADSRWLATGSEDRSVRVFDLKSAYPGGNQKVLLGHQLEITDLQFAPNGRWIATGSRDNTVRIWDLQSETATPTAQILKGHNGWISSLAISADGQWFATAGYDQSVRLWKTDSILSGTTEKESQLIVSEQGTVQKVAFTPDSASLITYGANRSVKIWDIGAESFADRSVEISRNISSFSFGENGRWLILTSNTTGESGGQTTVSLWPLKFEDMVRQATRFKEMALPTDLHQREEAYAKQFEQQMIR